MSKSTRIMINFKKGDAPQLNMLKIAYSNSGLDMSFSNFIRFMAVEFCLRIEEAARAGTDVDEVLKEKLDEAGNTTDEPVAE